jgi:hypothetical protein
MSKADDYRRLAAECLTMAGTNIDRRSREALLHMAEVWIKLADEDAPATLQQHQIQPKKPGASPQSS